MSRDGELSVDSDEPAYQARAAGGQVLDEPSEDTIFELLTDLSEPDNTRLTIAPPGAGAPWRAVVSLLPGGGFEVEYHDTTGGEHRVVTETNPDRIALDLIVWVSSMVRDGRW
jgi:hypothetical protein